MSFLPPRLPLSSLGCKDEGDHDEEPSTSGKGQRIFSARGRSRNAVVPFTEDDDDGVDMSVNQKHSSSTSRVSSVISSATRAASAVKATWSSIPSPRLSPRVLSTRGSKQSASPRRGSDKARGEHPESLHASQQASSHASPKASPQASARSSPQASPQASPHASPQASPQASPWASPRASPRASPHSSPKPASTRVSQAQAWSHTSPTVSSSLSQSEAGYPTTPVQDAKSWWKGSSSRFSSKGEASPRASPKDSPSRSRHDNTREANPWWKMSSPRRSSSSSRAATLQNASPKPSSTKLQHQCAHEPAEGDARSKQKNSSSRGFSRELFADRKAEEVGIHQTAATCQTEPDEVKALADELLSAVYGEALAQDAASRVMKSCPEVEWLAQCGIGAPLPATWIKKASRKGVFFINTKTGEESQVMPQFSHFALMARLVLKARQSKNDAHKALARVAALRDNIFEEAAALLKGWSGPHIDPSSGAEFFYCQAKGESSWTNPAASETYVAYVADRLLHSAAFAGTEDKNAEQRHTVKDAKEVARPTAKQDAQQDAHQFETQRDTVKDAKRVARPTAKQDAQQDAHQFETQQVQTNVRDLLDPDMIQKVSNVGTDMRVDRTAAIALADAAAAIAAAATAIAGGDGKGPAITGTASAEHVQTTMQGGGRTITAPFQSMVSNGVDREKELSLLRLRKRDKVTAEHFKIDSGSEGEDTDSGDESFAEPGQGARCAHTERHKNDMEMFMRQQPLRSRPPSVQPHMQEKIAEATHRTGGGEIDTQLGSETDASICATVDRPSGTMSELAHPDSAQPATSAAKAATAPASTTISSSEQSASIPVTAKAGTPASFANDSTVATKDPVQLCMSESVIADCNSHHEVSREARPHPEVAAHVCPATSPKKVLCAPSTLETNTVIDKSRTVDTATPNKASQDERTLPEQAHLPPPKVQSLPPFRPPHPTVDSTPPSHPSPCKVVIPNASVDEKCDPSTRAACPAVCPIPAQGATSATASMCDARTGATAAPPPPPPTALPVKHVPARLNTGTSVTGSSSRPASPSPSPSLPGPLPKPLLQPGPLPTANSKVDGGVQDRAKLMPRAVGGA